jgi:hypothetical protein
MKPVYARAGDTFFTRTDSLLGFLIRRGEREKGEEASWTNHMGVIVESGWIGGDGPQAVVVEALWRVQRAPLRMNGTEVRVFRPVPPYTGPEMNRFQSAAESSIGQKYGWWKLLGFLLKKFTGLNLPNFYFIDRRPICSFLAAKINEAARPIGSRPEGHRGLMWLGFGMRPQAADPDEALDFAERNPQYWEEVL